MADEPKDQGNAEAWQSFGRRRPAASEPAIDPSKPPVKRSRTVSLVLLGSAAVMAVAIAEHDPSQNEEDVLIYPNAEACIGAKVRDDEDCRRDFDAARAAYATSAPRYDTMSDCESHHGSAHCVAGETVSESARGKFLPLMAAYMMGRTVQQALAAQPLYDHQPATGTSSSGYGGYCTSSGGRIWTSGGGRSSSARVSSTVARGTSYGGFGSTGRSFSSSSAHGSSGGG